MKTKSILVSFLACLSTSIHAENYSIYKYTASRRLNACYPANNFQGHDISPNKLLAKYPCEIRNQSDSLGTIFIHCQESPLGPREIAFLFIKNSRDCDRALEALQQM